MDIVWLFQGCYPVVVEYIFREHGVVAMEVFKYIIAFQVICLHVKCFSFKSMATTTFNVIFIFINIAILLIVKTSEAEHNHYGKNPGMHRHNQSNFLIFQWAEFERFKLDTVSA